MASVDRIKSIVTTLAVRIAAVTGYSVFVCPAQELSHVPPGNRMGLLIGDRRVAVPESAEKVYGVTFEILERSVGVKLGIVKTDNIRETRLYVERKKALGRRPGVWDVFRIGIYKMQPRGVVRVTSSWNTTIRSPR